VQERGRERRAKEGTQQDPKAPNEWFENLDKWMQAVDAPAGMPEVCASLLPFVLELVLKQDRPTALHRINFDRVLSVCDLSLSDFT